MRHVATVYAHFFLNTVGRDHGRGQPDCQKSGDDIIPASLTADTVLSQIVIERVQVRESIGGAPIPGELRPSPPDR